MAYVAIIVQSRLMSMDESLEEAAMDLGGHPLRVVFDITLPLIAPAMVAGWLLAFTLSLDDLVIASFVSGPGSNTLPMYIFSKVKLGVSPDINALATLIILFVSAGVLLPGWSRAAGPRPAIPAGSTRYRSALLFPSRRTGPARSTSSARLWNC